jgi:hypothetical protein
VFFIYLIPYFMDPLAWNLFLGRHPPFEVILHFSMLCLMGCFSWSSHTCYHWRFDLLKNSSLWRCPALDVTFHTFYFLLMGHLTLGSGGFMVLCPR